MTDLTRSLVGFAPLQVRALTGTYVNLTGTNTVSAVNTFSAANTFSSDATFTGKVSLEGGVLPASATLTPAQGAANICLVTLQLKDGGGTNLATSRTVDIWLSDAATGIGLTATTASGTVVAGASGTDMFTFTAKKHLKVQTTAAGLYILAITDTAKTGFYVCAQIQGAGNYQISAQLVAGNYG